MVTAASAVGSVAQAIADLGGRVFSLMDYAGLRGSPLFERVRGFPLFAACDDSSLERIIAEATWFGLPGGTDLDRGGENDEAIFLVVSGRLSVRVTDDKGHERIVGNVPAGETAGEMSMIAGESAGTHSARLVAVRDTELLRLSKPAFLRITSRDPRVMATLTQLIIRRLRATTARASALTRPKTFALIPLEPGANALAFAARLSTSLTQMGVSVASFDVGHRDEPVENQYNAEIRNDLVLYVGDEAGSIWSQHAIRQADRVLLLTRAVAEARGRAFEQVAAAGRRYELIVLHDDAQANVSLDEPSFGRHNIRTAKTGDIARLARIMTGRSIGLILAGGGARGYAHIGAVRALREAGLVIDRLGGASIGAMIAAGLAMDWDDDELERRMRHTFVNSKVLNDYTVPIVALLRGSKVGKHLRDHFGDMRIEDMPLPFFAMTSDLTTGHAVAHRTGLLSRVLKASASIPGLLPPVVIDGHLHVDGGIMNNLPVDVMAADARGPIIAIDVVGDAGIAYDDEAYGDEGWFAGWTRRKKSNPPTLAAILLRAGTVGNETQRRLARAQADLVIDPPLDGIGLTHWKKFDAAVESGYRVTKAIIAKGLPDVLSPGSDDEPAALEPQVADVIALTKESA